MFAVSIFLFTGSGAMQGLDPCHTGMPERQCHVMDSVGSDHQPLRLLPQEDIMRSGIRFVELQPLDHHHRYISLLFRMPVPGGLEQYR